MSREDVHNEMQQMFGTVISFVDQIPDDYIDAEWDLMKRVQFGETLIPNKYKELMGLNGLQVDYESFADEVRRVVSHVTSQAAA